MSSNSLVSVVIPFFNAERFIQEAIESVFAQTYADWELLLVDDGSTDGSTEIALRYTEQYFTKVYYLEHDGHQNRGVCASRNLGIRHAKGEYIALLDADDVWLPHKLRQQVAILDSQPEAAMIYGLSQYWNGWTGNPKDIHHDYVPELGVQSNTLFKPPTLLTLLYPLGKATAPCPSDLLFRREIIQRIGGFEESFDVQHKYQLYEDQAFLAKVYLNVPVFVANECWDRYRLHPNSCDSMVTKSGEYHLVRLFFLNWLSEYLSKHGVKDDKVWEALWKALWPYWHSMQTGQPEHNPRGYFKERDIREIKWWLRVAGGNVANLEFPLNNPELVRIDIKKAKTKTSFDIQLNESYLKVRSNHRYIINFLARADRPRSIIVGFARAHEPWTGLGLYRKIDLTSEWQSFQENFVATAGDDNARIHFDVGNSDISVELSSVSLRNLSNGESIEPDLSHTQIYESEKAAVEKQSDNWRQPAGERKRVTRGQTEQPTILEKVRFGMLRRVTPISRNWGLDRGLPIDRYYIENFLSCHADCIRGRVLEVGDNSYTRKFGSSRVTTSDVLHVVEGNPHATIAGDLTRADHIPSDIFDCIILTQTLQFIYDVQAALKTIHRILKPGGVLLATFPGISQTYDREWGDRWYWSFTTMSARRLFNEVFLAANVKVEAFGNVLVAISFLHGLAVEELSPEELDHHEPGYEVTITVKAAKPEALV